MTGCRGPAVAIALLCAALATAGCGLGPGKGIGDVELTVTRDYGTVPVLHRQVGDVSESDTVMRVLEGNADISTRYGGGFVQSIDGLEAEESVVRSLDWFFYVDGVEATVGAADYPLRGGESVWWDYRDWGAAMRVPAVVGSWPQPFTGGYDGKRRPAVVECLGGGEACATARARLRGAGATVASGSPDGAIRVLVGPWARLRRDPAAAQIEAGPQASGVFADFRASGCNVLSACQGGKTLHRAAAGYVLRGLDEDGKPARSFGADAGLVAATRRYEDPPVWVVTGANAAGVEGAAGLLDAADLRDHYAVAVEAGEETPLPLR
ncbi:MAG TPA: DUF4430 domain-containing protein [Solirubrobacterales bacterium]|jgi:hypothetical protein|nr:DUF4430 domain-containing protein [Solirubrobacterales bacterium]